MNSILQSQRAVAPDCVRVTFDALSSLCIQVNKSFRARDRGAEIHLALRSKEMQIWYLSANWEECEAVMNRCRFDGHIWIDPDDTTDSGLKRRRRVSRALPTPIPPDLSADHSPQSSPEIHVENRLRRFIPLPAPVALLHVP
jgi:hypothetical protein